MAKKYTLKKLVKTGSLEPFVDEARFSINYKEELNKTQFEAASAIKGSYLVIAGAGTGKTRTLVYRVSRLIEMGYDPKSILLLTFTRKAAREMMNRATELLDNRCSKINGGTFHSFANMTLRRYAKAIGLNPNFTILDQGDSEDLINLIRGKMDVAKLKKRFPNKKTILKVISLSVNTSRPVNNIIADDYPHFIEQTDKVLEIKIRYEKYKESNSLLDYDDLLLYLLKLLTSKGDVANHFLSSINFIMVDEYQDTNKLQADIVKALATFNSNVMVVGDDSQSIYSFRGADFKNIMNFPILFKDTKLIKLEENYRSTKEILNLANYLLEFAVEKYPKELFTNISDGELPAIISASNDNMQSRFIVERILELREEGLPIGDIAVLFRSAYHSFNLEVELNKASIPFVKIGGLKFIETAHIKDALAFVRIAMNTKDLISWYRILLLHEGIGPKRAQLIMEEIEKINFQSFNFANLKSEKLFAKVIPLFNLINSLQNDRNKLPYDKLVLIYTYYDSIFEAKYDDFNKRRKDLEALNNIASNYDNTTTFLADMVLEPPRDSSNNMDAEDKDDEQLIISTIHSAKGLEWHSVFIMHAIDGFFPSSQSFDKQATIEEERRLMYVAVTRAKRNLFISYPTNVFDRYNGYTIAMPSRFIANIPETLADEWIIEEDN
ncbi:MAG: ATP-dependent helicase [Melioribacteraceae bacterium]|jgi:DNA helicase-2/ATP-dependent DNA helicase PcrA|nr:ATP-dependent helicase [Melioribacteraceae bacterium]